MRRQPTWKGARLAAGVQGESMYSAHPKTAVPPMTRRDGKDTVPACQSFLTAGRFGRLRGLHGPG